MGDLEKSRYASNVGPAYVCCDYTEEHEGSHE
jgi:hypothetical protein